MGRVIYAFFSQRVNSRYRAMCMILNGYLGNNYYDNYLNGI